MDQDGGESCRKIPPEATQEAKAHLALVAANDVDVISHKSYYFGMRMTLSIPDAVAHRFQAAVPARQRSRLVTRLLQNELSERDSSLAAACRAANRDRDLAREIDEWQAFDDGIDE